MTEAVAKQRRKARRREKTIEELRQEEWLSVPEAARYTGLSRSKTYELVKRGNMPATKIPGYANTYKVNRRLLDEWMHANRYRPGNPDRG